MSEPKNVYGFNCSERCLFCGKPCNGVCPICWKNGEVSHAARERRPNGNDVCEKGHTYPSKDALDSFSVS